MALNLRVSGGRFTVLQVARRGDLDRIEQACCDSLGEEAWRAAHAAGAAAPPDDLLAGTAN